MFLRGFGNIFRFQKAQISRHTMRQEFWYRLVLIIGKKVLQAALIGNLCAYKRAKSDILVLTRRLNRIFLCLQEGLIGDFRDYKQPTNLENMKKEKRLITKTGLRTGDLVSKTRQQIRQITPEKWIFACFAIMANPISQA